MFVKKLSPEAMNVFGHLHQVRIWSFLFNGCERLNIFLYTFSFVTCVTTVGERVA